MRIAIASDHAAWELKAALTDWLREAGHKVEDLGTNGPDSVDYPDYGYALGQAIAEGRAERGVALCGPGIERKSVVEGKSVDVSVDLGGRRLITKKKNKHK